MAGSGEGLTDDEMKELMRKIEEVELDLAPLDPQREVLAGLQAARRIRTRPKTRIQDVKTFDISLDPSQEDYLRLMTEIQDYISKVRSLCIFGKPVTPPLVPLDEEQYYIIRISKNGDGKGKHVKKLFRASDMYYLAFQPCGLETPHPFYRFSDIKLPSWIVSYPLAQNSGHGKNLDSIFGAYWWDHIFSNDIKCTISNCESHDAKASQWSILLLAEPPRLMSLQKDVVGVISDGGVADIGCSEEGIHNWKTLSKIGFRYVLKPTFEKSMMLLHTHTKYTLFNAKKKKYVPWEVVGPSGEIRVFKYDNLLVMNIIKVQQDQALNTLHSVLQEPQLPSPRGTWRRRIHPSQQQNVPILLSYILVHGQEFSIEVRQAAGLLLQESVQEEFSSMVPADKEYIKSEMLTCIWEPDKVIRSAAQAVIVKVLEIIHSVQWIQLINSLYNCLNSEMPELMEGAMELLYKICFKMSHELEYHVPGLDQLPVNMFVEKWLDLFESPDPGARRFAIDCVNNYIAWTPSLLDIYLDQYLEALVNLYQTNWATNDENGWEERYVAAMSMSAIADKCIDRAHSCLPQVILILTQLLREDAPSLLSLACETVSKYSKYIVQRLSCEDGCNQFDEMIQSLLEKNTHSDESVQLDASAALSNIEKEYLTHEGVISELNSRMSPFPLLQCLRSIAKAVRPGFSQFLVPVFRDCTALLGSQLYAKQKCNKKISSACMQLLSSVVAQGLPAGTECSSEIALPSSARFQTLIEENRLISMLAECCGDEDVDIDVAASALKLLGDLSKVIQGESLAKVSSILAMYDGEE